MHNWHETRQKQTLISLFFVTAVFRFSPVTHQLLSLFCSLLLLPSNAYSFIHFPGLRSLKCIDFYVKSFFAASAPQLSQHPNKISECCPPVLSSVSSLLLSFTLWLHFWLLRSYHQVKSRRGADILLFFGIVTVPLNVHQWAALCSVLSDSPVSFSILKLAWHLRTVSPLAHWLILPVAWWLRLHDRSLFALRFQVHQCDHRFDYVKSNFCSTPGRRQSCQQKTKKLWK